MSLSAMRGAPRHGSSGVTSESAKRITLTRGVQTRPNEFRTLRWIPAQTEDSAQTCCVACSRELESPELPCWGPPRQVNRKCAIHTRHCRAAWVGFERVVGRRCDEPHAHACKREPGVPIGNNPMDL